MAWWREEREPQVPGLPPQRLPQPGSRARKRLCRCHLFSWLHCLATARPCLLSAPEEDAFLHGPSGRMRSHALARAAPHDGFNDYDFLMWGLLSHVTDPVPSGVSSLKGLLEGKYCTHLMPVNVYVHTQAYGHVHRCKSLCGCEHCEFKPRASSVSEVEHLYV